MRLRSAAIVIVFAVVGVTACGSDSSPGTTTPLYALRRDGLPGHCLVGGDGVYQPVDCDQAHTVEVSATLDYPDDAAYPGGGIGIPMQFFEDCDAGFLSYVGVAPDRSSVPPGALRSVPIIPSVTVWNEGDRHVVCTVRAEDAWTGSVRGLEDLTPPGLGVDVAGPPAASC